MTSVSYELIFSEFLSNITDYSLIRDPEEVTIARMMEWLHKALAQTHLRRIFSSISLDDETEEIQYELETTVDDESDVEFVIYILSKGMVVEWLEPFVKKTTLINQMFGGKEQKFFSQKEHLSEVKSLLNETKIEVRGLIRDRGYIYNSYLEG